MNNPGDNVERILTGRKKIILDYDFVTDENVVNIINDSLPLHVVNQSEIGYLYNYYKGRQPILDKEREYQQEINNKVLENRASQIVNFKFGQLMRKPIRYISADNANNAEEIKQLNRVCQLCHKHSADKRVIKWMLICGVGYRFVAYHAPKFKWQTVLDTYFLDPMNTESIYSSKSGHPLILTYTHRTYTSLAVTHHEYMAYTEDTCYRIVDDKVVEKIPFYTNGVNPIIPYELNDERIGAFEWVINLLDCINKVESGRLDGLDQFINALLIFHNVDANDDTVKRLRELNAIIFGDRSADMPGEVKYLNSELNQSQVQTLVDYMWQAVLEIVGMPNRNGGSSTSDTGQATTLRDGFADAEARAAETEEQYIEAEYNFIVIACNILATQGIVDIDPTEVGVRFTRRIFENQQLKAQILVTLLGSDKVAPRLAYVASDMFDDSEEACREGMAWFEYLRKIDGEPSKGETDETTTITEDDSGD